MSDDAQAIRFAGRPLPQWYDDAKFGIFVHWGPYAVPCYAPVDRDMGELMRAGDWAEVFRWSPYTEWYLNSWSLEGSPTAERHATHYGDVTYADFVAEFRERASGADTGRWASLFAQAGARYVVPVTKHHDGFLMWPSAVPNPHRDGWMSDRDHIGELVDAARAEGLRAGLYYSGGIDWTFVPPPIPDLAGMFRAIPDSAEYGEYATAHVHELITRYRPSVLWNDIGWPAHLDPNDIIGDYYECVPDGVVNDRFDMLAVGQGRLHADINTPEYSTTASPARKWEVCRGIGRSFGYNRMESEATFPSVDEQIWMLVDIVGRGGNLLLNVGPSADGLIPMAQVLRLTTLGWWLRVNGAAIYGTRPGGVALTGDGRDARITHGEGVTYVIVHGAPEDKLRIELPKPADGSEVRMLGNERALPHRWVDGELDVRLPDHLPASPATVFAVSSA